MKTVLLNEERNMLQDAALFKVKASLTNKLQHKLTNLEEELYRQLALSKDVFPLECFELRGKITKGENLVGLPWMVLDFPRVFQRDHIFAIRTLIWWGKHASISMVATGDFKSNLEKKIFKNIKENTFDGLYFYINHTPWDHDLTVKNSVKSSKLSSKQKDNLRKQNFIKASYKIPLSKIESFEKIAVRRFKCLTKLIEDN